ncbi:hypothetical protein ABIC83_003034 [Roseateles asaccharophilus]|uniref:hypothetical protein n=1 Tax=Roseateles asaccharophilus TaxID=582607 RepID=UPI0038376F95
MRKLSLNELHLVAGGDTDELDPEADDSAGGGEAGGYGGGGAGGGGGGGGTYSSGVDPMGNPTQFPPPPPPPPAPEPYPWFTKDAKTPGAVLGVRG